MEHARSAARLVILKMVGNRVLVSLCRTILLVRTIDVSQTRPDVLLTNDSIARCNT